MLAPTYVERIQQLPGLPSELLRGALADLRDAEKQPDVSVNMEVWYAYSPSRQLCQLCLAGAVLLAKGVPPNSVFDSDGLLPKEIRPKLYALDDLRNGDIARAFESLNLELPEEMPYYRQIADYDEDREQFYTDLEGLAVLLEDYGY